jgi:hypothetical protein
MKKNILNKVLLMTTLVLGFTSCKKGEVDLLKKPEPFKAVREITGRERYSLVTDIVNKATTITNVVGKAKQHTFNNLTGDHQYLEAEAEDKIFKNNSYISKETSHIRQVSGSGFEYPSIEYETGITQFWYEDTLYKITYDNENSRHKKNHTFSKTLAYEDEIHPLCEIYEARVPLDFILDASIYLTDKGDYRVVREMFEYDVEFLEEYYHTLQTLYMDVHINKDFEFVRTYFEFALYDGNFPDGAQRNPSDLNKYFDGTAGMRYEYGELKRFPNVNTKWISFPETTFEKSELEIIGYQTQIVNDEIQVVASSAELIAEYYCNEYLNSDGSAEGDVFYRGLVLRENHAIQLALNYYPTRLYDDGTVTTVPFSFNIEFDNSNLREDELEYLKIITQSLNGEDVNFLVYTPNDSQPEEIYIYFAIEYEMLNQMLGGSPIGQVTIKNVEIRHDRDPFI